MWRLISYVLAFFGWIFLALGFANDSWRLFIFGALLIVASNVELRNVSQPE